MNITNFNKVEYWKKRIREKLLSTFKQVYANLKEVEDIADNNNFRTKKISLAIDKLVEDYKNLDKLFSEAEVKSGK